MLNAREIKSRLRSAADQEIPMTNYGILIAYMKGILKRSMGHWSRSGRQFFNGFLRVTVKVLNSYET